MISLLLSASIAVGAPTTMLANGWGVQVTQNPMTDIVQAAAQKRGSGVALTIWCDTDRDNSLHAEVKIDEYLGSDDMRMVAYRLDQSPPVVGRWHVTTRGPGTTVFPSSLLLERFVEGVLEAKRLVVQSGTYEQNARPVVRVLNVEGASEVASIIRPYCLASKSPD